MCWPDTLPGAAAGPPHLLMPLLHDQRGRQRFLGLETVPVLAERTLPAPYPPDKMIFPGVKFAVDSLLEQRGFELSVPPAGAGLFRR
jgi:hypothetical protein